MKYCFNPQCLNPSNPLDIKTSTCLTCGYPLKMFTPDIPNIEYLKGLQLLGQGGFGQAIEAKDHSDQHHVVKILDLSKIGSKIRKNAIELFEKEANILSQLQHPGIPRVPQNGYFIWPDKTKHSSPSKIESMYCIVMEKIDGSNLQTWLSSRENWPIEEKYVISWLKELVEILSYIHAKDYIHRDIKPSNIMRCNSGQLVLIDFGVARRLTDTYLKKIIHKGREDSTVHTVVPSSYGYTPLEQIDGRAVPQSDFFALGRTFVHILTGKHPTYEKFELDSQTGQLKWRSYAPDVSESFAKLIDDLMEPSFFKRPKNTQVILQRIAQIESELSGSKQIVKFKRSLTNQDQFARILQDREFYKQLEEIWQEAKQVVRPAAEIGLTSTLVTSFQTNTLPSPQEFINKFLEAIKILSLANILSWVKNSPRTGAKVPVVIILIFLLAVGIPSISNVVSQKQNYNSQSSYLGGSSYDRSSEVIQNRRFNQSGEITPTYSPRTVDANQNRTLNQPAYIPPTPSPSYSRRKYVSSVVFSSDGKLIAIAYHHAQVKIWETETGNLIQTLPIYSRRPITFSPNGKTIVTISMDETVQLWDIKTGKIQRIIPENSNYSVPVQRTTSEVNRELEAATKPRLRAKENE